MNTHDVSIGRRNPPEYVIMGMLLTGPAHGYGMHQRLEEELGPVWKLGQSQVYALLGRLEKDGMVSHVRMAGQRRPDRKRYCLTRAGRAQLGRWFRSPVAGVRDLRLEFMAKLHFAGRSGKRAERALVVAQLASLSKQCAGLSSREDGAASDTHRRGRAFRLAMLGASVAWLEQILAELDLGANRR